VEAVVRRRPVRAAVSTARPGRLDQLDPEAVPVGQRDHALAEPPEGPSKSVASPARRTIQASSPPGGTRYATALAMPGPARPGPASANGKKVRMVPGEPARSP
jgi:hypothetical protein